MSLSSDLAAYAQQTSDPLMRVKLLEAAVDAGRLERFADERVQEAREDFETRCEPRFLRRVK